MERAFIINRRISEYHTFWEVQRLSLFDVITPQAEKIRVGNESLITC